jgi:hypothetical protein
MSHVYSFFLVGLFSYSALRILDGSTRPARGTHTFLFVVSGSLLVLVRQLNILVFLFPLLTTFGSEEGPRGFIRRLFTHRISFVLALVLAAIPWVLQSMYWHHILGEYVAYTYGKKGEHFDFTNIVPGLILTSPRNGWLVYTPLMLPVIIVLLFNAWRNTSPARPIALLLTVSLILYSAWWCWWLGSSYGFRGFVDIYALLAIPLAWMFRSVLDGPWSIRLVTGIALVALIYLNFGLMERWTWEWSNPEWTWQRYFEQVSLIFVG